MKILLINPPFQRLSRIKNSYFPLGLGYLASSLHSQGYFVRIYNADIGEEDKTFPTIISNSNRIYAQQNYIDALKDRHHLVWVEIENTIKEFAPDIIGISAMTPTLPSAYRVAEICKTLNKNCPIIFGGIHPTVQPEEVIANENVDYVVIGEAERTIVELADALQSSKEILNKIDGLLYINDGTKRQNLPREFEPDIDKFPLPARNLVLRPKLYSANNMGALITARGCPFRCTFCNAKQLWTRKVRYRSVENILDEIKEIINLYNVKHLRFNDDSFTVNRHWVLNLCRRIIEEDLNISWTCLSRVDLLDQEMLEVMREGGCTSISFGIESGSDRVLKLIQKDTNREMILQALKLVRKNRINFSTCFLIGLPFETASDMRETIELVKRIKPDFTNVCTYTPYPGSELYNECVKEGLIDDNIDWSKFSQHSPYNRFFKTMAEDEFLPLFNELVKTADKLNARLMKKLTREIGHAWHKYGWKLFLKNPLIVLQKIVQMTFKATSQKKERL